MEGMRSIGSSAAMAASNIRSPRARPLSWAWHRAASIRSASARGRRWAGFSAGRPAPASSTVLSTWVSGARPGPELSPSSISSRRRFLACSSWSRRIGSRRYSLVLPYWPDRTRWSTYSRRTSGRAKLMVVLLMAHMIPSAINDCQSFKASGACWCAGAGFSGSGSWRSSFSSDCPTLPAPVAAPRSRRAGCRRLPRP